MTNEGGKFYALMEGQSKTIIGQISNLGDAIDMMFNEIGQANEGIISDAISGASYLVENYEKVLSILKVLVSVCLYRWSRRVGTLITFGCLASLFHATLHDSLTLGLSWRRILLPKDCRFCLLRQIQTLKENYIGQKKRRVQAFHIQLLQFGYCLFIEIVTDKLLVLYPVLFISI